MDTSASKIGPVMSHRAYALKTYIQVVLMARKMSKYFQGLWALLYWSTTWAKHLNNQTHVRGSPTT
jgi:hypothetical protein